MDANPNPTRIFDAFTAYQRTAALKAAVELYLFTGVGADGIGVVTASALGPRFGASERCVRSLCDRLVVDALLVKTGDRYTLGVDAAAFLDRSSPACIGSAVTFLTSPMIG